MRLQLDVRRGPTLRAAALALATLALSGCPEPGEGFVDPLVQVELTSFGRGDVTDRYTAELAVRGNYAYTTTWNGGSSRGVGNVLNVWNVSGSAPALIRSIVVPDATTLGDVQVSDDGTLLVVATERANGSIVVYDLTNPTSPTQISRFTSASTSDGVHTAEVQRVNGTLYAFLSIDPGVNPARLVIVDLSDPRNPREVLSRTMGNPFVHDVFVRDGILFTALWNDGLTIWDIGGGGKGGTVENPVQLGNVRTVGGEVHNVWWFHDPSTGAKRYAFVGEEGPASLFTSSSGDIHVVDVSDMAAPREVAFFHVPGAGTHNFSMDEPNGILYAAYYNGGVRALDVRGDLGSCTAAQKASDGRCDLGAMQRQLAAGPPNAGRVFFWGVQFDGTFVFASDMLNGLWKLNAAAR